MVRILLWLSFIFLLIYCGYTTWALKVHKEIDVSQEERIRLRDEKILDLEYDLAQCQDAQVLRCGRLESEILRR